MASIVTGVPRGQDRPGASTGGFVRSRLARVIGGTPGDPGWLRPSLLLTLAATAVLFIWGLDHSGYANTYYSAAVLAATRSWSAFFFGSFDAANYITVDKPPLALWLMDLSARVFGVNAWSLLLPEALAGVASVALVFNLARRLFGPVPGIVAAVVMAVTPVAVVMFRYNNPDALLTLLLLAAAWAVVRALEDGRTRWLMLAGVFVGLGFMTKYLQAYMILPALVGVYLLAGEGGLLRRAGQLLAALPALLVSSGWWVAIVTAIPAASRPYIGGSTNNSVLDLIFGYDGLGRIFGQGRAVAGGAAAGVANAVAGNGAAGGSPFGGAPGLLRIFNSQLGGEISWLFPAALVSLVAGLYLWRRAPRTNLRRAGYVLFGLWLLVHAAVFSLAGGVVHPYYTVAMAPAVGALVGAGALDMWRWRARSVSGGIALGATVAGTAWWAHQLLARTPPFVPGLGTAILVAGVVAAAGLAMPTSVRRLKPLATAAAGLAVCALLAGPIAYAAASVQNIPGGGDPTAGPAQTLALGGPNGQGAPPSGPGPGGAAGFGPPPGAPTGFGPGAGAPPGALAGLPDGVSSRAAGGGPGGEGSADPALTGYLVQNRGTARWLVATASAMDGAAIQLATGQPVMAIGGFNGSDNALNVIQLQALVASGQLRFVTVGGGGPAGGPRGNSNSAVTEWVRGNGRVVNYGGSGTGTLYDLLGVAR